MALVKNKKGEIYFYHGESKYTNLSTGDKGKIPDDLAKKFFTIPVLLNRMAQDNEEVINLIIALNARLDIDEPD